MCGITSDIKTIAEACAVNNAANALFRPFDDNTVDDFHTVFNTNVGGVVFLIKAALPKMRRGGRIINISSRLARFTRGDPLILYSSSKAALEHLTRQLAFRYAAPLGITVNTVMPGPTDTGDWVKMPESIEHLLIRSPDAMEKYTTEVELLRNAATAEKRLGTVDDIAQVVTFVAEEGSRWINGDTINASGGAGMF